MNTKNTPTKRHDVAFREAQETYDELMLAVTSVQEWRERCLLSHGVMPPTAYYRVLLWLYLNEEREGDAPSIDHLAGKVGIARGGMGSVVKRMAYDCLVTLEQKHGDKAVTLTPEGKAMAQA